jgi:hypothetical protein
MGRSTVKRKSLFSRFVRQGRRIYDQKGDAIVKSNVHR